MWWQSLVLKKNLLLLSMLKTAVLLNIFVKNRDTFFKDYLMNRKKSMYLK